MSEDLDKAVDRAIKPWLAQFDQRVQYRDQLQNERQEEIKRRLGNIEQDQKDRDTKIQRLESGLNKLKDAPCKDTAAHVKDCHARNGWINSAKGIAVVIAIVTGLLAFLKAYLDSGQ